MTHSISSFLDSLLHYYACSQTPPTPVRVQQVHSTPVYAGYSPTHVIVNGNNPSPPVQVIASQPNTIRELRKNEVADRERSQKILTATLAAISTIAFTAIAAWVGRNVSNTQKELNRAVEFQNQQLPHLELDVQRELRPIVSKHIENLESKAFWSKASFVLSASALSWSVAAFAGGMFSIPWLVTAAIVGTVSTAAIGAGGAVWYFTGEHSLPSDMVRKIEQLRSHYSSH